MEGSRGQGIHQHTLTLGAHTVKAGSVVVAHKPDGAAKLGAVVAGLAAALIVPDARAVALVLACNNTAFQGQLAPRRFTSLRGRGGTTGGTWAGKHGGAGQSPKRMMALIWTPPEHALTVGAVAEEYVIGWVTNRLAELPGLVWRRADLVIAAARNCSVARARAAARWL
jgi:hypothetical protein